MRGYKIIARGDGITIKGDEIIVRRDLIYEIVAFNCGFQF